MPEPLEYRTPEPPLRSGAAIGLRILIAHVVASVGWFIAVEVVDVSRGGHVSLHREGLQLVMSPVLIFMAPLSWFLDFDRGWPLLLVSAPAYALSLWLAWIAIRRVMARRR